MHSSGDGAPLQAFAPHFPPAALYYPTQGG